MIVNNENKIVYLEREEDELIYDFRHENKNIPEYKWIEAEGIAMRVLNGLKYIPDGFSIVDCVLNPILAARVPFQDYINKLDLYLICHCVLEKVLEMAREEKDILVQEEILKTILNNCKEINEIFEWIYELLDN